jgi:putative acetyltransferase
MQIRPETAVDYAAVFAIHSAAFPTDAESRAVDMLRVASEECISLVVEDGVDDGAGVVGHIMFSPVTLDSEPGLKLMGLAPMAVMPARQRQGVGSALVRSGLAACRAYGAAAVVVLGHPEYYPRFGFVPAVGLGIACEYDVPDEAFMLIELFPSVLAGKSGVIRYADAFADL